MVAKNFSLHKKRKSPSHSSSFLILFLAIFVGIIGFLAFQNVKIFYKRSELSQRVQELRVQVEQLQQKRGELEQSISETQSTEYQEKVLREQGLYKKPGEDVFTILELQTQKENQNQEETQRIWWDPRTWFKSLRD